jgi:Leucine-rich repeat (LRR) protein
MFLDLSHTKLSSGSVEALIGLQPAMEQLSLCYTGITELIPAMFENKNIKVLDLSGNPLLYQNLHPYHLSGLEELEILIFRNSSINSIGIFSSLVSLRMLDLSENNIVYLSADNFTTLTQLEIFDVDNNQIYNWNRSIFANNLKLKILNLRANRITLMAEEMLRDFYTTR